jgi:DNA-binding protein HU-beta
MNKEQLIEDVRTRAEITKGDAARAVDAVVGSIMASLQRGDAVMVHGFGTFKVKARAARQGRNPKTGEPATIPARKAVVFSAGDALKKEVNK